MYLCIMKEALVDVSVLILFFNRPEPLKQVFAQVQEARPSRLFLYQDGPRSEKDMEGILACREVVSQIDWDCEVHQLYATTAATPLNLFPRNGHSAKQTNVWYWKMTMCPPFHSLHSARRCWTVTKTMNASL